MRAEIGALVFDLQVEQPHRVPGLPRRRGDQFEADRLEPQKNLRIGQRAGMDAEQPHQSSPPLALRGSGPSAGAGGRSRRYCEAEPRAPTGSADMINNAGPRPPASRRILPLEESQI